MTCFPGGFGEKSAIRRSNRAANSLAEGRPRCITVLVTLCIVCFFAARKVSAQWVQQQYQISPGWNSVFLSVDPAPFQADLVWAGLPVTAVWSRDVDPSLHAQPNACTNPDDPTCTPPDDSGWRVWIPPGNPNAIATSLRVVRGGRVYLIRASSAFQWSVTGRPNGAPTRWQIGANLIGFHVVSNSSLTPTFSAFMAPFLSLSGSSVFEIQSNGILSPIVSTGLTRISPGKGYWIKSTKSGTYDGPVEIDRGSLRGIDFAKRLNEHPLTIGNLGTTSRTVTVSRIASAAVPSNSGELPTLAGQVPLRWLDYDTNTGNDALPWRTFSSQAMSLTGVSQAGSRRTLRLAVDRAGLGPAELDENGFGATYQSVLEVTDGSGFRRWISVATQVTTGVATQTAGGAGLGGKAGLYAGTATVNAVSWVTAGARQWLNEDPNNPVLMPGQPGDATAPRPTSQEFSVPLLLHVSSTGVVKMLHEVDLMWQPESPPERPIGRFVLVTPECPANVRATLEPAGIRDGEAFSRRLSTAAYHFANAQGQDVDLSLAGDITTAMQGSSMLRQSHRLNPFRHSYHPDHDCNQNEECYDITRTFGFTTATQPGPGEFRPGFGESYFIGTYNETITGLYKGPIQVRGRFELARVSTIDTLNAQ